MTETGGDDAPARAGYVDDAIRRIRVAAAAAGRGGAPGAAGTTDLEVLRTALASLSPDDQRLLWATHVQRQESSAVAATLGTHPRTAARLLPQAEQALATALAGAHARGCPPGCADTRAALLDLVHRRLPAGQEAELEDHLLDCAGCLRAFVDVREPAWALRDAGPRLLAGGWCPPAVAATGNGATNATGGATVESRPVRRQSWLIVAGTVACVAVAAVAIALGTGDAAPAAPDPGSSPEATTVGTVPGGTSSLATPSSAPPGDGTPSAGPTPSGDATAPPSAEPSPTASADDDAEEADPSTSPTSSAGEEPTTSPTSSGSTSSTPTSRPSSTPTTAPTDEGSPTGTPTPTEEPTDEPTTESPPPEPTDPAPTDPEPTDPEPTDPDPSETPPVQPTE